MFECVLEAAANFIEFKLVFRFYLTSLIYRPIYIIYPFNRDVNFSSNILRFGTATLFTLAVLLLESGKIFCCSGRSPLFMFVSLTFIVAGSAFRPILWWWCLKSRKILLDNFCVIIAVNHFDFVLIEKIRPLTPIFDTTLL